MSVSAPQARSWREAAAAVAAAVDVLAQAPLADLADAELETALEQAAVQASRLHAVAAGLVAEADSRRVWRTQGASSLRGWVRRRVQLADDAARLVAIARMRAFMPRMSALFSAGRVSLAQMGTAARQVRRLPDGPKWQDAAAPGAAAIPGAAIPGAVPAEPPGSGGGEFAPALWGDLWAAADDILAARAHAADARMLAALGEQIHAAADPGGHLGDEQTLRERRHLSVARGFEGMGEVTGRLDPEAAERAITVLNALAKKSGPEDDRTVAQRRADAFDTLCRSWLASGNLPPPKEGGPRRDRVIVTVPFRTLTGARGAPAAVLSDGTTISAQAARRIACDASIRRVVTASPGDHAACPCGHTCSFTSPPDSTNAPHHANPGDRLERARPHPADRLERARPHPGGGSGRAGGDPPRYDPTAALTAVLRAAIAALPPPLGARPAILDAGRATPTFTQPMRDALHAQYGGRCAFPGCGQPATIDHHLTHWADGGPTSTANAAPLCDYHHYLVHEGGWHLHKTPHGTLTTIPPPPGWPGPRRHWRNGHPITGPPPNPHPPPGNGYPL